MLWSPVINPPILYFINSLSFQWQHSLFHTDCGRSPSYWTLFLTMVSTVSMVISVSPYPADIRDLLDIHMWLVTHETLFILILTQISPLTRQGPLKIKCNIKIVIECESFSNISSIIYSLHSTDPRERTHKCVIPQKTRTDPPYSPILLLLTVLTPTFLYK